VAASLDLQIKQSQLAWAKRRGISLDADGYCLEVDRNLLQPLSACARRELAAGDGAELGKEGARGKLQALHSSSALACNVFEYWRGRDLHALRAALRVPERLCEIHFEEKFPTGLGRYSPNLDVVLHAANGGLFAIESKFTEPYKRSTKKSYLKPKYFSAKGPHWGNAGLPTCQRLAEALRDGEVAFELFDAAQILKHMLGLALKGEPWRLFYLWYDPGGADAKCHQAEIRSFSARLGAESAYFVALTHQELFRRLCGEVGSDHGSYVKYLRARYFGKTVA
jgi:hypothetical protein